jgi:hypothetical protein
VVVWVSTWVPGLSSITVFSYVGIEAFWSGRVPVRVIYVFNLYVRSMGL